MNDAIAMLTTDEPRLSDEVWTHRTWVGRAIRGAGAGLVGTVLMSFVQWPTALVDGHDPPPIEVTRRLQARLGRRPRRPILLLEGAALHCAFGAAAGALYGIVAPRRAQEATGVGFAGVIWASSYLGWLPMARLHPSAPRDDPGRQLGNAAAHVVYGLALAEAMRISTPNRPLR